MPATTTIPAGATGADFVGPTADIDAWLDEHESRFVVRYIAAGGTWKHITAAEIEHHHARGIAVVLNSEGSATDYTGGATRGAVMGANARAAAEHLGYPAGLPLIVSVDTGLTASALPIAKAFVLAFFAAAAPYRPGLYGPANLYHAVRQFAPFYWLPNATSWQAGLTADDVVHVRQQRSLHPPGIDPNIAVHAFPAWLPTPDPQPVVEDEMRIIVLDKRLGGAGYYADTLAPVGPDVVAAAKADTAGHRVIEQDHEPTTQAFQHRNGAQVAVTLERFRDSRDGVAD